MIFQYFTLPTTDSFAALSTSSSTPQKMEPIERHFVKLNLSRPPSKRLFGHGVKANNPLFFLQSAQF